MIQNQTQAGRHDHVLQRSAAAAWAVPGQGVQSSRRLASHMRRKSGRPISSGGCFAAPRLQTKITNCKWRLKLPRIQFKLVDGDEGPCAQGRTRVLCWEACVARRCGAASHRVQQAAMQEPFGTRCSSGALGKPTWLPIGISSTPKLGGFFYRGLYFQGRCKPCSESSESRSPRCALI